MNYFTEFVHFINSEKRFVFSNTKTFENSVSVEEYQNLPVDQEKLVKYNELTLPKFKTYIDTIKDIIENEISDVFDSGDKDHINEVHNKMLRLIAVLSKYEKLNFDKLSISHPDTDIEIFDELSVLEKKQIIDFLKIERDLAYNLKELIKKQEKEFGVKVIASNFENVTGFKFNTTKNIDLNIIHLYLEGVLLSCDYKAFRRVFNGEPLKTPQKIKWLLKHQKDCHKRALIYFLSQPIFESVDDDVDLQAKILFSFADANGETFDQKALKENFRQYNNDITKIESKHTTPIWKRIVDERIQLIQNYLQS